MIFMLLLVVIIDIVLNMHQVYELVVYIINQMSLSKYHHLLN